jgi:hypothetical protein
VNKHHTSQSRSKSTADNRLRSQLAEADSLFLGLMGIPFNSDLTTTIFRLTEATLRRKKSVTIWTCGYSTTITQATSIRSPDPIHPDGASQNCAYTLAQIAQALLQRYPQQLRWYVCQYCMEERGATNQIVDVEIKLPFSFNTYLNQADKGLVIGTK